MDEALDPRSIDRAGIYLDLTNKTQHLRQVFSPETKYFFFFGTKQSMGNYIVQVKADENKKRTTGINGWKNWW